MGNLCKCVNYQEAGERRWEEGEDWDDAVDVADVFVGQAKVPRLQSQVREGHGDAKVPQGIAQLFIYFWKKYMELFMGNSKGVINSKLGPWLVSSPCWWWRCRLPSWLSRSSSDPFWKGSNFITFPQKENTLWAPPFSISLQRDSKVDWISSGRRKIISQKSDFLRERWDHLFSMRKYSSRCCSNSRL